MLSSVTIGGQPIAFDWQCKIREFLRDRLPPEEVLFSRWMRQPKMHAAVIDNYEALTPPYPPLPPIEIGEMQWPSGASRYARALYLVDKVSLLKIATAAWGLDTVAQGGYDAIDDYLSDWGAGAETPGDVSELELSIYGEEQFVAKMLPLPPYRIPGAHADLWLLPLVDRRFLWQHIPYEPDGYAASWSALFTDLANTIGAPIAVAAVAGQYGVPDSLVIKRGVSAAALLDCAALSIGRRVVIDPNSSLLRVMTAADSDARCVATIKKNTIVAGSFRGKAVLPSQLAVFCRKANEFSLACNEQEKRTATVGDGAFTQLAHSAWIVDERYVGASLIAANDSDTDYYVEKVASDLAGWLNSGGQYAFAGAIQYAPSGYDDYLTIKTAEVAPEEYWFASRVYELPAVFLPNLLLSQSENIRVASVVEQFTAKDQDTDPGFANFPGNASQTVAVSGLTSADSSTAITAFYRCGYGWTKISGSSSSVTSGMELYSFVLAADLTAAAGAMAAATLTSASDGTVVAGFVTNPGEFFALTGAEGVAAKVAPDVYWILVVNQPALRVRVVLGNHPNDNNASEYTNRFGADPRETNAAIQTASLNAPVALTPFPFSYLPDLSSGSVANPHKLFGESGDTAVIAWDKNTSGYFLEEVFPQRQLELWANLYSSRSDGLAQDMLCKPGTPASDGAMPAEPFTVTDTYNVAIHAKTNDRVLVKWDAYGAKYVAVVAEHEARRVKGTLAADFDGTPADFEVTVTDGMDGEAPASPITVQNRYDWEFGKSGDAIEVLWDTVAGEWYPEQCQAPEDPAPTYVN